MNSTTLIVEFVNSNSSGIYDGEEVDINKKYYLNIIVPILWSLIIIFGVLGNGLIIYIILKRRLYKNSCTNCYIINVAIADLCFTLICVPITMSAYIYKEWIFGEFMCQFENLLIFSSVQAACLTLTAMTIDRYCAILYPLKSIDFRTTKVAFITSIIIWIASFTLNIPYFFYYQQIGHQVTEKSSLYNGTLYTKTIYYCQRNFPNRISEIIMTLYTVMIAYVLPLLTIIFCYMRMIFKILKNSKKGLMEEYHSSYSLSKNSTKISKSSKANSFNLNSVKKSDEKPKKITMKFKSKGLFSKKSTEKDSTQYVSISEKNKASTKKYKPNKNTNLAKKQRVKLLLLIATVAMTFAFLWLPAHVINIWKVVFNQYFPYSDTMYIMKVISHTLTYSNSLLNPIIYVFIGAKFRNYIYDEFNHVAKVLFFCSKKKEDKSTTVIEFNKYKSISKVSKLELV